jgi:hypothetical protein
MFSDSEETATNAIMAEMVQDWRTIEGDPVRRVLKEIV